MRFPLDWITSLLPNDFDFDNKKLFPRPKFKFPPDLTKPDYWVRIILATLVIFIISLLATAIPINLSLRPYVLMLLSMLLTAVYSLKAATNAFLQTVENKFEVSPKAMFIAAWKPTFYSSITSLILGFSLAVLFNIIIIGLTNTTFINLAESLVSLFIVLPLGSLVMSFVLGAISLFVMGLLTYLRHISMLNPMMFALIVKQIEKIFKSDDFEEKGVNEGQSNISVKEALTLSLDNALLYRHEHFLKPSKIEVLLLLKFVVVWILGIILLTLFLFSLPFDVFYISGLIIGIMPAAILFIPNIVRLAVLKRETLREILFKAKARKLEQGVGVKFLKQSFVIRRFWYIISTVFLILLFVGYNFFLEGLGNMLLVFTGSIVMSFTVLYLLELSLFLVKVGKKPL